MRGYLPLLSALFLVCVANQILAERPHDRSPKNRFQIPDQLSTEFFGESDQERETIEGIPIDWEVERRIGGNDVKAFLASLRKRKISVVQRGRDVEYISSLVDQIRPKMRHASRYAKIRIYVADSQDTDARAFPGGSIVVMTGYDRIRGK